MSPLRGLRRPPGTARKYPPICMHCEAADGVQCGRPDQGDLCAATGVADTADRRPIQQVAEMSGPRTCSDRVRGCPPVAEIPVSARGRMRAVPACSSSDSREIPKRHDHGRPGDGGACVRTAHERAGRARSSPRRGHLGAGSQARRSLLALAAPAAMRVAIAGPGQCSGIQRRSSTRQPRFEVIAWGVPVGTRSVPHRCRAGPDADQRRTSR